MSFRRLLSLFAGFLLTLLVTPTVSVAQGNPLGVTIARPSEGETLYYGPSSLLYNISITGTVVAREAALKDVSLTLEVLQNGALVGSQKITPHASGTYSFFATVNPAGTPGQHADNRRYMGLTDTCGGSCHDAKLTTLSLVPGDLLLRVTATDGRGNSSRAERNIIVDRSQRAMLPVRVVNRDVPGQNLGDIPVNASTWIYMWRARHYSAASNATDLANVMVEALSQAPTRYVLRVDPVVVDGVYYEGVEPLVVTFPPGEKTVPPVTIEVTSQQGDIAGAISPREILPAGSPHPTVWAVALAQGQCYQTEADDEGYFAFHNLPVASYVLAAETPDSGIRAIASSLADVNLRQEPSQKVMLTVSPAPSETVKVTVTGANGPLPFAWLTREDGSVVARAFPADGTLDVVDLPPAASAVVITAPGHYSHPASVTGEEKQLTVELMPEPSSQTLPWANGEIFIAADSLVSTGEEALRVERGWVWGEGGNPHPYRLLAGSVSVNLYESRFALEAQPGQPARFYLLAGTAELLVPGRPDPIPMRGPHVVTLEGAAPMPLTPAVFAILESQQSVKPPDAAWQPGLRAQLRDRLTMVGIGSAQVVTFVTYMLGILSVATIPLLLIFLLMRRRARRD